MTESTDLAKYFFNYMFIMYGDKFARGFPTAGIARLAKLEWIRQLEKFKAEVIETATEQLLTKYKDWPPTLPQVVELCRSAILKEHSVPAPHNAYQQACDNKVMHKFAWEAKRRVGAHRMKQANRETERLFFTCYQEVINEAFDGIPFGCNFKEPPLRIEEASSKVGCVKTEKSLQSHKEMMNLVKQIKLN